LRPSDLKKFRHNDGRQDNLKDKAFVFPNYFAAHHFAILLPALAYCAATPLRAAGHFSNNACPCIVVNHAERHSWELGRLTGGAFARHIAILAVRCCAVCLPGNYPKGTGRDSV
jgi:hypothetical protein